MSAWFTIFGTATVCLGLVGLPGLVQRARQSDAPAQRFLALALLVYLIVPVIVHGLWSSVFRFWYTIPPGYMLVLAAAAVLRVGLMALRREPMFGLAWVISGATVASILQSHAYIDDRWLLVAGGAFGGLVWLAGALLPNAWPTPRRTLGVATVLLCVMFAGGVSLSASRNLVGINPDSMEALATELRTAGIQAIYAPKFFALGEYELYFRGLPIVRVDKSASCPPDAATHGVAYMALDKVPDCWRDLGGERGRENNLYWVIQR